MEDFLSFLFKIDPNFSIMFMLNVFDIGNQIDQLVHFIRYKIHNKDLRTIILTTQYSNTILLKELKQFYFNSFDYEKTNLRERLQKCLTIDNDIIQIDSLCKVFASSFYGKITKNEDNNYLKSEFSTYQLVFALIILDISIKEASPCVYKKFFFDLQIMVKNLNEGENYNNDYLKNCFRFVKSIGLINMPSLVSSCNQNKQSIGLVLNEKYKHYACLFLNGALILFLNKKSTEINKMVHLNIKNFYKFEKDITNLIIKVDSATGKKNILIFKNKTSFIKYKKYSAIQLRFENKDFFEEVIQKIKETYIFLTTF
jgi:hypothetical protein